jgi:hypothetical protein
MLILSGRNPSTLTSANRFKHTLQADKKLTSNTIHSTAEYNSEKSDEAVFHYHEQYICTLYSSNNFGVHPIAKQFYRIPFYDLRDEAWKKTPWPESRSELHRPSDHRLSTKLVPTFADRGVLHAQHDGSLRPCSRFSRPEPLFLSSTSSIVLTRLRPFQVHYFLENLVRKESNPDLWICSQVLWPRDHRGGRLSKNGDKLYQMPDLHSATG